MKLWRYIQGNRKGIEAHRIEKEAMRDPFLADALEGYEKTPGNHQRRAARLQKEITRRQQRITSKSANRKTDHLKVRSMVACLLIIAGAGVWFLNVPAVKDTPPADRPEEKVLPVVPQVQAPEDKVIPEKPPVAKKEVKKTVEPVREKSVAVEEAVPVAPVIPQETDTIAQVVAEEPVVETAGAQQPSPETSDTALPQPVTGMQAYMNYVQRNMKRPDDDECRNVKGPVVVAFKIGQSGRPYNIRVTQGVCASINQEAIRLIIDGPDWKKTGTEKKRKKKNNLE